MDSARLSFIANRKWFIVILFFLQLTIYYIPPTTFAQQPVSRPASADSWSPFQQMGYEFQNLLAFLAGCGIMGGAKAFNVNEGCNARDSAGSLQVYNQLPGGGALGFVSNTITAMYVNPPTSSREYLADLGTNLGIVSPAYAQVVGSGNGVIRPILQVWQVSRNIAYLGFILVFLAVGFMIMFRQKLNPQTVVTIQSALPGLVIGLVLVTFSYFVAAILIDICFITMQLVAYLFNSAGHNVVVDATKLSKDTNILNLYGGFALNPDNWGQIAGSIQQSLVRTLPAGLFGDANNLIGKILGSVLGAGVGVVVTAIVVIALFIQMLRLFWQLLIAYISILVTTVGGPLLILIGSIPGRGGVISFWWRTILGNVLVFPAVFAAFLFAGLFLSKTSAADFNNTLPLFSGFPVDLLRIIIAYGIILGTPAIPKVVKGLLGVKDLGEIGAQGLAGFAAGAATGGKLFGPLQSTREAYQAKLAKDRAEAALEGRTVATGIFSGPAARVGTTYIRHGPVGMLNPFNWRVAKKTTT